MAFLMDFQQNENESRAAGGISALLKTIGGSGRGSGRGLYMFRLLMVGCTSAAVVGVGTAYASGIWAGAGAVGFLVGSWFGFISSTLLYYKSSLAHALHFAEKYPRLLRVHLIHNFPLFRFEELRMTQQRKNELPHIREGTLQWANGEDFRASVNKSFRLQGMAISAYQTAWATVDELHEREERALLADLSSGITEEHLSSAITAVDSADDCQ